MKILSLTIILFFTNSISYCNENKTYEILKNLILSYKITLPKSRFFIQSTIFFTAKYIRKLLIILFLNLGGLLGGLGDLGGMLDPKKL